MHNEASNNEDSGLTTSAKNNDDTASNISSVSTRAKTKQQRSQASKKMAVKVKDTWYTCRTCKSTHDEIVNHCKIFHKEKVHVCCVENCFKYFKSLNGLRIHCKTCHSEELGCSQCETVCVSFSMLTFHEDSHKISQIKCKACSKSFTCDSDSRHHWNYLCPQNSNRYMHCKHCLETEKDPDVPGGEPSLMTHLTKKHKLKGSYLCIYCHNLFEEEEDIDKHQLKCSKTRPNPDFAIID